VPRCWRAAGTADPPPDLQQRREGWGVSSPCPPPPGPAVVAGIRAGDRETGGSEAETSNPNHDGAMGSGDGTVAAAADRASREKMGAGGLGQS
jgi:hypothetical protein